MKTFYDKSLIFSITLQNSLLHCRRYNTLWKKEKVSIIHKKNMIFSRLQYGSLTTSGARWEKSLDDFTHKKIGHYSKDVLSWILLIKENPGQISNT